MLASRDSELNRYLQEVQSSGASLATFKNKRAYCTEYLRFCQATAIDGASPEAVAKYASLIWSNAATDRTISSKVGEVLKWCRWLEQEKALPKGVSFHAITTGNILKKLRQDGPPRR